MPEPLISVIIPCFNQGRFLAEAVNSVAAQSYSRWECLIVNDGSADNTAEVAAALCRADQRVKLISKENGGLSSARNAGLKQATGDFIQFLDADDFLRPGKFKTQVDLLMKNDVDVCYTNFDFFDDASKTVLPKEKDRRPEIKGDAYEDFLFNWVKGGLIIPIHCPLIRHSFLKTKAIVFDERVKAIEDWLFWLSVSENGARFLFVDESDALYRRHTESMTRDYKKMMYNYLSAVFYIYNNLRDEYKSRFVVRYADILAGEFEQEAKKAGALQSTLVYRTGEAVILPLVKLKKTFKKLIHVFR